MFAVREYFESCANSKLGGTRNLRSKFEFLLTLQITYLKRLNRNVSQFLRERQEKTEIILRKQQLIAKLFKNVR